MNVARLDGGLVHRAIQRDPIIVAYRGCRRRRRHRRVDGIPLRRKSEAKEGKENDGTGKMEELREASNSRPHS